MAEASLPTRYLFIFCPFVDFRGNWTAIVLCNLSVGGFFSLNDQAPDSSPASRFLIGFLCVRVCVGACVCVCVLEVMGDTSERSKPPTLPPRCPCGFWGSSKTMNLCSKCFADVQKKQPVEDCTPKPIQSTGSSQSPVFSSEMSSSSSQSLSLLPPSSSEQLSAEEPLPAFSSMREGKPGQPGQPMISHSPCSVFKN